MSRTWLRIAHRGASGRAPEHTGLAFALALAAGVDLIELDVQFSRDGELVVMHDASLERTTNGRGLVSEHDFADLRKLDAGGSFAPEFAGQRVLSLSEVVALVRRRARLNVEIKVLPAEWDMAAARLTTFLRDRGLLASTIISCFQPEALQAVRAKASTANLGLLWQQADLTEAWRWARDLKAVSFHPNWELVTDDLTLVARAHGLQTLAWTVNNVGTMRELLRHGVDGIMSDFPERFREIEEPDWLCLKTLPPDCAA